ncbi:Nramp family divalent metal transporter [Streptomyces rubrogriseus]|uniref:Nramp family divalent metal transporter n=1 Tax=Streptomyces rubrogriseus TaxID=194673 RepID=UPI00367860C3
MSTTAPARAAEHAQTDPYALRPEDARPAPETFRDRLRHLGPGFVLSAAVVGSGELITTTALGAKAGFALLWLVVLSTAVKVWVQMELARWTILNGRTALEGYREVGPRIGRLSWINWLWIGMDFAKMFQRGGIIGGTAAACSVLWPVVGDPLSWGSLALWAVVVTLAAICLLQSGKYSLVERACLVSVVVFRRHRRRDLPAGRGRRRLATAPHRSAGTLPHQSVADRGARRQQRRDPVRRRVRSPEDRGSRRGLAGGAAARDTGYSLDELLIPRGPERAGLMPDPVQLGEFLVGE